MNFFSLPHQRQELIFLIKRLIQSLKEALKGFWLMYSVCETMKDYKEGYLMVCASHISPWSSIVGLYFKGACDVISVTMATHQVLKIVL